MGDAVGREALQIVEIDMDRCTLTYGTGDCDAVLGTTGVRKCYNTFRTCQDPDNYDTGSETLRFARPQVGLPAGAVIYPALVSVSTNAAKINPRGGDRRSGPLGKRARVEVVMNDFVDADRQVDPYVAGRIDGTAQTDEGGYWPRDRGTFWTKLKRRWPHYDGRALRVREGYVGDAIASMPVRHYVIDKIEGPDASGRVKITAKDVLDLADNDKAKAPAISKGQLAADIDASVGAVLTLRPESIGDEYDASGWAAIGREIVTFDRSGDVLTLTGRGLEGTDATDHSAGDAVQQALRYKNATPARVARDLLRDYAGIDSGLIPYSEWTSEADRWLAGFRLTRVIPKPVGVTTLLAELAQLGIVWWWDETAQKIRMRANRPVDLDETAPLLTDDASFIEGSLTMADLSEDRLSQVHFYHGLIDAGSSVTDPENYSRVLVATDLESERADAHGRPAVQEIFCPWLGAGNTPVASAVASRLVRRYASTPREITASVDVKDKADLAVASLADLSTRLVVGETGEPETIRAQIVEIEETDPGHRLRIVLQEFRFDVRLGFVLANGAPDHGAASDTQKARGCFVAPNSGVFADGSPAYKIF